MNPFKSLVPVAKWILRIAAAGIIYLNYFDTAAKFSLNNLSYFIALAFVVLAILLIIGGYTKTAKLTVVSGLLIVVCSLIVLFGIQKFNLNNLLDILPLAAIGFYFMARGNKG